MTTVKQNKTFVIKRISDGELWTASSGKRSWKQKGHAKCAWANSYHPDSTPELEKIKQPRRYYQGSDKYVYPTFDQQDLYEVVEMVPQCETDLDKAKNILSRCLGRCDYDIEQEIKQFLKV